MTLTRATRFAADAASAEADAFSRLFEAHAQAVYAYCARRTADLSLAEDLTSITFLEAWRRRDRLDPKGGSPRAWLLGVAHNVVRNARRGRRRYHGALGRLPAPAPVPAAEDQAAARAATETGLRRALDAIGALSQREQDVVMVVLWAGLSYDEAARVLDIPVGTVRSRLARARGRLQISLDPSTPTTTEESS